MKNRIESKFLELRKKNQKALIAFVTAGDPNINISKKILNILNEQKVDIIEIGFPFSDPMADGPTIQKSSQRAIKAGTNLKSTFKLVNDFRKKERKTPIILIAPRGELSKFIINHDIGIHILPDKIHTFKLNMIKRDFSFNIQIQNYSLDKVTDYLLSL